MFAHIDETRLVTRKSYRKEIFEAWGYTCCYCGEPNAQTLDHLLPKDKGGSYDRSNLASCCFACNSKKGNKSLVDWYSKQAFFTEERLQRILDWMSE